MLFRSVTRTLPLFTAQPPVSLALAGSSELAVVCSSKRRLEKSLGAVVTAYNCLEARGVEVLLKEVLLRKKGFLRGRRPAT